LGENERLFEDVSNLALSPGKDSRSALSMFIDTKVRDKGRFQTNAILISEQREFSSRRRKY
jgi:hypothetical protein